MKKLYYIKGCLVCGCVAHAPGGFKWFPFTSARQPSRKSWPTPDAAIKGRISGGRLVECDDFKHALAIATGQAPMPTES